MGYLFVELDIDVITNVVIKIKWHGKYPALNNSKVYYFNMSYFTFTIIFSLHVFTIFLQTFKKILIKVLTFKH